jgi:hypothetical protein
MFFPTGKLLSQAYCVGRQKGIDWKRFQDWDVGGDLGRQVISQLNERQGTMKTLPLLLETPSGSPTPVALLFLHWTLLFFLV